MPSNDNNTVNSTLNLIRNYKFTFFDLTGDGPFTVNPVPDTLIQNSVNFSFTYTITNNLQNTCKFMFYNLAQSTIGLFVSQQNKRGFIFDAWYANDTTGNTTIFKGLTFTTNTYRQGADIITEVVGCDVFMNLMYKGIKQSFPAGTTYLTIVQTLLSYYGNFVSLNSISNQFLTGTYASPKTFIGQLNTILQQIASDAGLIYSFQLNSITMIPVDLSIVRPNAVQTITSKNGLVGYPRAEAISVQLFPVTYFNAVSLDKNLSLVTVNTLLRAYNLYDKVQLSSQQFQGFYGILSITHSGEWRGNPWYSTLKLWPDTNAGSS